MLHLPRVGLSGRPFISPLKNNLSEVSKKVDQIKKEEIKDAPLNNSDDSKINRKNEELINDSIGNTSSSSLSKTTFIKKPFKSPLVKKLESKPIVTLHQTSANEHTLTYTEQIKKKIEEREANIQNYAFSVLFTNFSNKKHKSWEDGVLDIRNNIYTLFDMSGKVITKQTMNENPEKFIPGCTLQLYKKELEFVEAIPVSEVRSGRFFIKNNGGFNTTLPSVPTASVNSKAIASKSFLDFRKNNEKKEKLKELKENENQESDSENDKSKKPNTSINSNKSQPLERKLKGPTPLFDPTLPGAVIINKGHPPKDGLGRTLIDVVLDPCLLLLFILSHFLIFLFLL